jgi:hypothetical protein
MTFALGFTIVTAISTSLVITNLKLLATNLARAPFILLLLFA